MWRMFWARVEHKTVPSWKSQMEMRRECGKRMCRDHQLKQLVSMPRRYTLYGTLRSSIVKVIGQCMYTLRWECILRWMGMNSKIIKLLAKCMYTPKMGTKRPRPKHVLSNLAAVLIFPSWEEGTFPVFIFPNDPANPTFFLGNFLALILYAHIFLMSCASLSFISAPPNFHLCLLIRKLLL